MFLPAEISDRFHPEYGSFQDTWKGRACLYRTCTAWRFGQCPDLICAAPSNPCQENNNYTAGTMCGSLCRRDRGTADSGCRESDEILFPGGIIPAKRTAGIRTGGTA